MHSDSGLSAEQEALLEHLTHSQSQVLALAQAGTLDQRRIRQIAESEASLTTLLHPMPRDPAEHVRAAHTFVRPYLERLPLHDPTRLVVADEEPSYTPRKILRRVLDHALDHLNQIEQWLVWQQQSIVPTPTDGWASSAETFQEDIQPLSPEELQAWLWRIDLVVGLVAQRASVLRAEQLDWQPPDGGWPLRQALHHLALAEVFYAIWLDESLPDDSLARYSTASQRFREQLRRVFTRSGGEHLVLFSESGASITTAEQIAPHVLAEEHFQ